MKQNIPTQFLQINLANSDEIKNWAERSIRFADSNKVGLKRSHATVEGSRVLDRNEWDVGSGSDFQAPIQVGASGGSGFAEAHWSAGAGPKNQSPLPSQEGVMKPTKPYKVAAGSRPGASPNPVTRGHPVNFTKLPTATIIGEITRPDTLNYRTLKPEKDGLFCERIFGPTVDWICSCGQTKERSNFSINPPDRASPLQSPSRWLPTEGGSAAMLVGTSPALQEGGLASGNQHRKPIDLRINNFVGPTATNHERALQGMFPIRCCPVCQVDATTSRFRRYRMGYIGLACPVTHSWYLNSRPNLFSILLKIPAKYIKKIAYYKAYSPSRALPEYLSGLLSPGGDFFDNEWEFLHLWLAGNNSSHDIPAPWMPEPTGCIQSKVSRFELRAAGAGKPFSETDWQNQTGPADQSSAMEDRGVGLPARSWAGLGEASSLSTPSSAPPGTGGKSTGEASREAKPGPSGTPFLFRTMPETPQWLENTGAQALFNQLETRNWKNEINRLENQTIQRASIATIVSENREASWNGPDAPGGFGLPGQPPVPGFFESSFAPLPDSEKPISQSGAQPPVPSDDSKKPGTGGWFGDGVVTKQTIRSIPNDRAGIQYPIPVTSYPPMSKKRKARIRQLKLLKIFQKSGFPTGQMIFSNLPVLPPELRPIIQLGGGRGLVLASSDVNDLYRRVISRNNRLKYYRYETHFVEFLIRSEQQLVQLAVDALIENGKTTQVRHTSGQRRLYKSLSDRIGGKQGRFRMNLLGKRVDYSGRSVIVVGPQLHLQECGLPYEMAIELFQPFVLRHLLELDICSTIRSAKNILRLNKALGRHILHSIIGSHPILLNRAPTLHRLGIQAFQPRLVFGRAIHLHPLVCPAFNADFDGDQMAVHVPLSPSARIEARLLLLSSGAWLQSSTGQPNLLPSQDMVLGFYYATFERYGFQKGKGLIYQSMTEALNAFQSNILDLHSQIWFRSSSSLPPVGGFKGLNRTKDRIPPVRLESPHVAGCEANHLASQTNMNDSKKLGKFPSELASQSPARSFAFQPGIGGKVVDHPILPRFVETGYKVASSEGTQSVLSLWHQTKKFSYITGDSLSRKSTPHKHIGHGKDILAKFTGLLAEYSPVTSYRPDANGSREEVDGFEISKNTKAYKFLSRAFDSRISLQCSPGKSEGTLEVKPVGFQRDGLFGSVSDSVSSEARIRDRTRFQKIRSSRSNQEILPNQLKTGILDRTIVKNENSINYKPSARLLARRIGEATPFKRSIQQSGGKGYGIRSNSLATKSPEEPIQIRLRSNGISLIIYTSYYWQESSFLNPFSCYIRTTPGRILFNQMIQKYL